MSALKKFATPALLILIVILFYWKLTLTSQYSWMESADLAYMTLPWYQFQAVEWHHFRFPLWDSTYFMGQTLFGQAQPGAAYPPNWLLFLVPFKAGVIRERALDWYFVLIRCLAAVNAYALCRGLGRSRRAALIGGTVFALGGYIANETIPGKVNGMVWAPLVLLYFFRAVRDEKPWPSAVLSGFFLGVTWLGGHHEAPIFLSLAMAALWAWSSFFGRGRYGGLGWRLGAASLALGALASGFQTIPLLEFSARAVRWLGLPTDPVGVGQTVPYTNHEQYALKPIALLAPLFPHLDDDLSNPFVGALALGLAVLGAIVYWRQKEARWLAALGLGGMLFALGGSSLLHGVLYAVVPLLDKARSPNAATILFALAVAPLAAFGADALPDIAAVRWSRLVGRVVGWIGVVAAVASLGFYLARVDPAIPGQVLMITALCALLGAAAMAGWRTGFISGRAGAAAVLALILFDLSNGSTYAMAPKSLESHSLYLKRLSQHTDIAAFLRAAQAKEPARIDYDDQVIPYNFGDWFGMDSLIAYTASAPANIWRMDIFSARGHDFFGVRYWLGKTSNREGQREVYQGASGVKIFENPGAYPRAWTVHEAIALPEGISARDALDAPQFDPRRIVFVDHGATPNLESCDPAGDLVRISLHRANLVRITAHLGCRGMVILTDSWFPGWRATVDGRDAAIEEVDGAVRGVTVDAGDHRIEMRYRPWSVMVGAGMSLFAVALVLWVRRYGDRPRSGPRVS